MSNENDIFNNNRRPEGRETPHADMMSRRPSPYPTKKHKWEDSYTRASFYIEHELWYMLNERVDNEKGKKTAIINRAIKEYFERHPDPSYDDR